MRLFVALAIPDEVAASLWLLQGGVPGARWQKREQLHLTLRFIGEVEGHEAVALDDALAMIEASPFDLRLNGVGSFGGKIPRDLWAGAESNEALLHLQKKIETVCQRLWLAPDGRKFTPHVTLARLKSSPNAAVGDWLVQHGLYASPAFPVDSFCLYSSMLTSDGSIYRIEKEYPL
jgi:2'-5' RNA ligase